MQMLWLRILMLKGKCRSPFDMFTEFWEVQTDIIKLR